MARAGGTCGWRLAGAVCLLAVLAGLPCPAGAAEPLVLQLDRPAQFRFAGYLAALWHGFYRDAGLDVEVKPGARSGPAPTDPVREVTEGRAQFGIGDAGLLIRAAQGLPLLILAPIFQQSGVEIYYRADGDFASPAALAGARVGRLPASDIRDIELRSALAAEGVAADTLHSVTLAPGETLDKFAQHQIDAAAGSEWQLPWQARQQGIALRSFDPAQYRAAFYGDSLFALQRFAAAHPDIVRRFRAASLRGWQYALQHPGEIITRLLQLPPPIAGKDPAGFARYQSEIAIKLARYPAVALGTSNPERWRHIEQSLLTAHAMARTADLGAVLYDPAAAAARRSGEARRIVIAAAAAVFVLAAALLVWRWRRRWRHGIARRGVGGGRAPTIAVAALAEELHDIAAAISLPLAQLHGAARSQPHLREACEAAQTALDRLGAVARRLALASPAAAIEPRPSDLNATLTGLSGAIRRSLPGGIGLRYSLLPEPWLCDADPDAVAAAVLDLAAAAGGAVDAGGEVIVGTRHFPVDAAAADEYRDAAVGDYVRVTVRDNGPGLSQQRLDSAFDPDTTQDPAICAAAQLTRRLGGFARVESAEDIGTAVHLYFRRSAEGGGAAEDDRPAKAAE